jgi:hypothetical protein
VQLSEAARRFAPGTGAGAFAEQGGPEVAAGSDGGAYPRPSWLPRRCRSEGSSLWASPGDDLPGKLLVTAHNLAVLWLGEAMWACPS